MHSAKEDMIIGIIITFIVPIILTIVMVLQWDKNNAVIMGIVIAIIWLIAFLITYFVVKSAKKNPYPFSYLVDYDTLINYMSAEDKFSKENNLEAGFHFYMYQKNERVELCSWYYSFSSIESERVKGNIYYYNKEEYTSLEDLINTKIPRFSDYILIELIEADNVTLNKYKEEHKELDVKSYIENMKNQNN